MTYSATIRRFYTAVYTKLKRDYEQTLRELSTAKIPDTDKVMWAKYINEGIQDCDRRIAEAERINNPAYGNENLHY
jgi:hypothetical protein